MNLIRFLILLCGLVLSSCFIRPDQVFISSENDFSHKNRIDNEQLLQSIRSKETVLNATVFIVNNKKVSYNKFINTNAFDSISVMIDSVSIRNLGYSNDIKKVIIGEKKSQ